MKEIYLNEVRSSRKTYKKCWCPKLKTLYWFLDAWTRRQKKKNEIQNDIDSSKESDTYRGWCQSVLQTINCKVQHILTEVHPLFYFKLETMTSRQLCITENIILPTLISMNSSPPSRSFFSARLSPPAPWRTPPVPPLLTPRMSSSASMPSRIEEPAWPTVGSPLSLPLAWFCPSWSWGWRWASWKEEEKYLTSTCWFKLTS